MKLNYAAQARSEAPTVVMFVNDVGLLHFSYRRYLEKRIRERFGLTGNPIKLVLRAGKGDRNPPTGHGASRQGRPARGTGKKAPGTPRRR